MLWPNYNKRWCFSKTGVCFLKSMLFFSVEDDWFTPELSDFADSCGENIPVLLKHASPSSAACGQTLYRLTWMLCMRTWRKTLFYFSKVRHNVMRILDRSSTWVLKWVSPELQAHEMFMWWFWRQKKYIYFSCRWSVLESTAVNATGRFSQKHLRPGLPLQNKVSGCCSALQKRSLHCVLHRPWVLEVGHILAFPIFFFDLAICVMLGQI